MIGTVINGYAAEQDMLTDAIVPWRHLPQGGYPVLSSLLPPVLECFKVDVKAHDFSKLSSAPSSNRTSQITSEDLRNFFF